MRLLLVSNMVILVIGVLTSGILAWVNRGSSNVALATAALVGAVVLYGIQLGFELRRRVFVDRVCTDFTIDRAVPNIRQWAYDPKGPIGRAANEDSIGRWLSKAAPTAFGIDRALVTNDFAIRSIVEFMTLTEFDGQLRRAVFSGPSVGTITQWGSVSTDHDSTPVSRHRLQTLLEQSGNLFAGAPFNQRDPALRLPPRSVLEVGRDFVSIQNPICLLSFHVFSPDSVSFMKPGTGGDVPTLPSGEAQLETRLIAVQIERTFFALRAHDPDGDDTESGLIASSLAYEHGLKAEPEMASNTACSRPAAKSSGGRLMPERWTEITQ